MIRIPEIRETAGVNYGSVYHHFGSREGLIDAAYRNVHDRTRKKWFRKDLDARAMAVMFQVVVIGRVLDDISSQPVTENEWGPIVTRALSAFLTE